MFSCYILQLSPPTEKCREDPPSYDTVVQSEMVRINQDSTLKIKDINIIMSIKLANMVTSIVPQPVLLKTNLPLA